MSLAVALVRAVHFACLMILFGSESLQMLFRTRLANPSSVPLPTSLPAWLAWLALATGILWFLVVASAMSDSAAPFDPVQIWLMAKGTFFGRVFFGRLVLLALLAAAVARESPRVFRIILGGAALATIGLTSHAAASGDPRWMLVRATNDALHLLAAGFWIGGLSVLVSLSFSHRDSPKALLAPLQMFSSWGIAAVALLIAAGSINAWLILFVAHASWSLFYTSLLAAKIVLAAVMVALALTNRFGFLPVIRRGRTLPAEGLAASTSAELILGIAIIAIVAFLGTMSPWAG